MRRSHFSVSSVLKKFKTKLHRKSKPQGRKTVVTMSTSTNMKVTFSTSTKETNTEEQKVNNLPTGMLERYMPGDKGELVLNNGYGYGYSSNLDTWPMFSILPSEFVSQIHMIMPLHEKAVFIVTKDKTVYSLGTDDHVMVDIDYLRFKSYQPEKIDELCGKNVYFFYIEGAMFALTEKGEVYAWGENKHNRLGLESHESECPRLLLLPTKITKFNEEHIIEMAISDDHNIALTKDGKVYTWGRPEYEDTFSNRTEKKGVPCQVKFDFDSDKIIHVSCGSHFDMVVTENGNVYSWGMDDFGVLGLNNYERAIVTRPSIISSLKDTVIVKVVCGYCHTLALTDKGELYVWGRNNIRQLGYKTEGHIPIPTKLNVPEMGKIMDIFVHYDLSAAINEKQHVYIWGSFYDKAVPVPTFIHLSNMYNILKYEIPYIINKAQVYHIEDKSELQYLIFNDSSTSDITIEVDGKVFSAHKIILIRSQHFVNLLTCKMLKKNRIIVHDKYSYNVYEAFLKYIYTGMVDVSSEEALELMKLADAYNETNLKNICIKEIQKGINSHNVGFIFKEANSYNLKELKERCFEFLFMEVVNMVQKAK